MAEPADLVQVIKQEWESQGGDPADEDLFMLNVPIEPQEDAIEAAGYYANDVSNRNRDVGWWRDGQDMRLKDGANPSSVTLSDLAGGLTESAHESLNNLVHLLARGGYGTVLYGLGDARPTSHTVYRDVSKTIKDRECTVTYDGPGGRPDTIVVKQYDDVGTLITGQTLTVTVSYNADLLPYDYAVAMS